MKLQNSEFRIQNSEVRISTAALETLKCHLISSYPNEGCGVLIGKIGAGGCVDIHAAMGTRNAETIRGEDRFVIDPRDLIAIQSDLDRTRDGSRIAGFFHSHPDTPARPSQIDLEMALGLFDVAREFFIYAIARVDKNSAREISFWRLNEDASEFSEMNWSVLD